ncbi:MULTISPECIES: hypothetical protein [Moritella]|uniref:Protein-L-isoaspartate (D-aspartate) O-methyltransferase n=1 Tax=Moritella viscosa TaxID=80854 RepID=A0A1K9ZWD9_9GAMM|nr:MULTISPECIES: hypothetical protein [Moritella]SGZ03011.1 Protein-L-isoaspartate (D-aspartate) O-methyltransferase [Moritella viscosa]SGZ03541.1 Protein-L-isoaspartate (D-aspartate) O-methyltransferase [Moritella viscosa]SGZ09579.1 Protein-L-isoaspartate (D-aspartate) O-methyltransferase [Moritella viscosa]SHO11384.1 Protein-L-isoaspartate (D-aspartate) O-methyltransferase [Moritella viscosa]SHO11387.1 Protein-L-isoaspartate (D-aspartate) O-methyltransferase [Moritella viscosa]
MLITGLNSAYNVVKIAQGVIEYYHEHPGYVFVPLIIDTDN